MPSIHVWMVALALAALAPWLVRGLAAEFRRRVRRRTLEVLDRMASERGRPLPEGDGRDETRPLPEGGGRDETRPSISDETKDEA